MRFVEEINRFREISLIIHNSQSSHSYFFYTFDKFIESLHNIIEGLHNTLDWSLIFF